MIFKGEERYITRVVCGYNPYVNKKQGTNTLYQQHRRFYVDKENDLSCQYMRFWDDLVKQLKKWRGEG